VLFTASSMLCGAAPSLAAMIVFRIMQGLGGGGLQPMAQAIMSDSFPAHRRGLAFALYGVTVVIAPIIGPTLGGWITDSYTWRWIFFINLPVGLLALALIARLVEDPPYLKRARANGVKIDYVGVALLVLGVGALQIMLDKGQEDDWFGSHFILVLAIVAGVCLTGLAIWEWFYHEPFIEMRLFKNLSYLSCNLMMFVVGVVLFSSLVMLPQFMQTLMGYTATSAGLVLSTSGVISLLELPLVGKLTTKVQARYLAAFGSLLVAFGMYYSVGRLQLGMSFGFAQWMRVIQVLGLPFLFVPITLVAYVGLPAEKGNSIAGMLNFMRNIGSSVGTSFVTTMIARRAQLHQVYLTAHLTPGSPKLEEAAAGLAAHLTQSGLDAPTATERAYAMIYRGLVGQAVTLAYVDTFALLELGGILMFLLTFLLKKNDPHTGGKRPVE